MALPCVTFNCLAFHQFLRQKHVNVKTEFIAIKAKRKVHSHIFHDLSKIPTKILMQKKSSIVSNKITIIINMYSFTFFIFYLRLLIRIKSFHFCRYVCQVFGKNFVSCFSFLQIDFTLSVVNLPSRKFALKRGSCFKFIGQPVHG